MIRPAALCVSLSILGACAKPSSLPVEPIAQPAPVAADPRLCAPLEAEPPVAGTIVVPVTAEEREATREHLTSDADARSWGRRGWERASVAGQTCETPPSAPPRPG